MCMVLVSELIHDKIHGRFATCSNKPGVEKLFHSRSHCFSAVNKELGDIYLRVVNISDISAIGFVDEDVQRKVGVRASRV